jgi:Asp-tRNA(Asn)/Glu-tRNA(Gln) amidotransferase A subunit family amidase
MRLFLVVLQSRVSASAKEADQALAKGNHRGFLHGLPMAPKDLTATYGNCYHPWFTAFKKSNAIE